MEIATAGHHDSVRHPVLTDDVVELRPFTRDDAAAHLAGEDDEIIRWLGEGEASTTATVEAWIERNRRSWDQDGPVFAFAIRERSSGRLVGHVDANAAANGMAPGEANVSYSLHRAARGRGYATRAVELVCGFLREHGFAGAVIKVEPPNAASLAVAERAGFHRDGATTGSDGAHLLVFRRALRVDD